MAACLVVLAMSVPIPQAALAAPGGLPSQAPAGAMTGFFSSFEAADPQPTWTNTVETDAAGDKKASGVTGSTVTSIPGNIMDKVVAVEASGENAAAGEVKENLTDGDVDTKWLVFQSTGWVQFQLSEPVAVVHYALTSANDAPTRDPRDWTLRGSQDGQSWTTLDTRTDQVFTERFQTKEYRFDNTQAYRYYRLDITRNSGSTILQLAEVQLSDGSDTTETAGDPKSWVLKGSNDGQNWTVLDQRDDETFRWRLQTRAFKTAREGMFAYYRIEVTENTGQPATSLAEAEFLS